MQNGEGKERRSSFRIEDEIHLDFRLIADGSDDGNRDSDAGMHTCRALMQLRELSSQQGHILSNIRKQYSDIAQYLTLLDKKIDAVAQIAGAMSMGGEMHANTRANISTGGLAFSYSEQVETGQRLSMRLVLFPSHLCIQPRGRVIYCRERSQALPELRYRIGIEFEPLTETEYDQLIRHLLEKQSAQRRKERHLQ